MTTGMADIKPPLMLPLVLMALIDSPVMVVTTQASEMMITPSAVEIMNMNYEHEVWHPSDRFSSN